MPKLSALLQGAEIQLPLKYGGTVKALKVADNHYNKGETILVIVNKNVFYSPFTESQGFWGGDESEIPFYTYRSTPTFVNCQMFVRQLSSSIISSLIPVMIFPASGGYQAIYDVCFPPSMTEVLNSVARPSYCEDGYTQKTIGSHINGLNVLTREITGADYTTSVVRDLARKSSNSCNGSHDYNVLCMRVGAPGFYTDYPNEVNFDRGTTGIGNPLLSIDSNVEVASSNGGAITKTTAVESYRKIDGVWYRTT